MKKIIFSLLLIYGMNVAYACEKPKLNHTYDSIECLQSNGLAVVNHQNKSGIVNQQGQWIVPLQYDSIYDFSHGLAMVVSNGKYGYIDETGKLALPLIYDGASSFDKAGLARVTPQHSQLEGMINTKGKWVIPAQYHFIYNIDSSDLYAASDINQRSGYLNTKGKVAIPFIYDNALPFSQNLGKVTLNGKSGFVNRQGKVVIPLQYDYAISFDSLGFAIVKRNQYYGLIDTTGKEVLPLIYDKIVTELKHSEDLITVWKDGKSGFVNIQNQVVIPLMYDWAHPFSNGLAAVKYQGKYGYIDAQNQFKIPAVFDVAHTFQHGIAKVQQDGNFFYINLQGQNCYCKPFNGKIHHWE